MAVKVT